MRSPVIAFGILAATVSPTLIAAAPAGAGPNLPTTGLGVTRFTGGGTPNLPGTPPLPGGVGSPNALGLIPAGGGKTRRANDADTAGGNARSGNTASSDGGSILNDADDDTTMTNDDSSEWFVRGL